VIHTRSLIMNHAHVYITGSYQNACRYMQVDLDSMAVHGGFIGYATGVRTGRPCDRPKPVNSYIGDGNQHLPESDQRGSMSQQGHSGGAVRGQLTGLIPR
jgi:hypothetical protein